MADPWGAGGGSGGGSDPWGGGGGGSSWLSGGGGSSAPRKKGGGGLLGTLGHIVKQTPIDLYDIAVEAPGGIAAVTAASADALYNEIRHPLTVQHNTKLDRIIKGYGEQTKETLQHPLRHPGVTALTVAPVVGGAARLGEAGAAASQAGRAGASASEVLRTGAKTIISPQIGERTLSVDGATARYHYSRAAGARVTQKGVDRLLETGLPGTRRLAQGRFAKWNERALRVQQARERAAGTRVAVLGEKLKPEEQLALRFVAEEQPVGVRIAASELRAQRATNPKERARHQQRIATQRAALALVDESSGKPVLRDARLQRVYDALDRASGERGGILRSLDLLDEQAQQAAKVKAARFAAGARTVKGGVPLTINRVKIGDKVTVPGGFRGTVTAVDRKGGNVRVTSYDVGNQAHYEQSYAVADLDKPGSNVVGAEGVTLTPDAPFIGNPVERTRLTGQPKVSSRRTLGHTNRPASLKTSTGGAVEHALERQDVTNIVAERHAEAVRLRDVQRRVELVKPALRAYPTSDRDVWVWTDKTVSHERLPDVVRQYLDNPEGLRALPDRQQRTVMQQLRDATFQRDWALEPDAHTRFAELARQGKGGFISRRMLGNAGKTEHHLPYEKQLDTINNAQKLGLVYLKLAYPLVQGFSNAAMNMIQGIAHPLEVAKAVKLDAQVAPEHAAMVDDLMGEGAVLQAQFEGSGPVSALSQKTASWISRKVDRPFRRNAFYQEAIRAGFDTPDRIGALLEDDANANRLSEVTQRGWESIVDFGEMGPTEQNVIRRLIFVYPWQKGAVKYAGHFLRDHPVQAAALAQVGLMARRQNEATLGPTPSYLRGMFDVGGGRAVNPAGVNFFQTPATIGHALANPTSGELQNFLAPAPGGLVGALTGRDDLGRPLSPNLGTAAAQLTINGVPAYEAGRAAVGHGRSSKTFPDSSDPMYRFFLGGLWPRRYDKGALNRARALQNLPR